MPFRARLRVKLETMPDKLRRFLKFSLGGALALAVWAALFGAASGLGIYGWILVMSPNRHNTLLSIASGTTGVCAGGALVLGSLLFGGAALLAPERKNDFGALVKSCVMRSLIVAPLSALAGSAIAAIIANSLGAEKDVAPPYFFGMIAGWFLGFFAGLIWGVIAGVIRLRKGEIPVKIRPVPPSNSPPIAAP